MAKIYLNGKWVDLTSVDEARLLPAVVSTDDMIIGDVGPEGNPQWTKTSKSEILSNVNSRLFDLEQANNNLEILTKTYQFTSDDLIDGVLTKSLTELGLSAAAPVLIYDNQGYDVSSDSRITMRWNNDTLIVNLSAIGTINETWTLRFVGIVAVKTKVVSHAYGLPIVEVGGNSCHLLDDTYTELKLADFARNVSAIEFYVRSASDTITGNIVIIPYVGSTELDPITLSVTTTDVKKTIEFNPPVTGMISFKRDTSSESDTLKDEDVVSAIIGSDLMIMVNS